MQMAGREHKFFKEIFYISHYAKIYIENVLDWETDGSRKKWDETLFNLITDIPTPCL